MKSNRARVMREAHRQYREAREWAHNRNFSFSELFSRALKNAWRKEFDFLVRCQQEAQEKVAREEEERILAENKIEWKEWTIESHERLLWGAMEASRPFKGMDIFQSISIMKANFNNQAI